MNLLSKAIQNKQTYPATRNEHRHVDGHAEESAKIKFEKKIAF